MREAQRALDLTRAHKQRGMEAQAWRVLGDIHATGQAADVRVAESHLRKAGSIAEELQMRPLRAHSHLGLARLYATADQPADAARHLEAAKALYRELNMVHCLQRADVAAAPRED